MKPVNAQKEDWVGGSWRAWPRWEPEGHGWPRSAWRAWGSLDLGSLGPRFGGPGNPRDS